MTDIKIVMGIEDLRLHSPPWQQKIFSSTMAATGKQLKQSVKVFHSLMLYRRLPEQIRMTCEYWRVSFVEDQIQYLYWY